ncbi:MAG: tetratricopeptide repeat protein [Flavobacteriales bacterium]|nr:tetratricopeptide repeat protein [Flavobacteriales bacterium]
MMKTFDRIKVGLFLVLTLPLLRCTEDATSKGCVDRLTAIAEMEERMLESPEALNASLRSDLMRAYAEFSNGCHDYEQTPEFLFRRADLLRSAGQFQEAMTQLRDIHDHYKDFDKRPICAFLVGFIAEVELNDREQARKIYEQVVELHPESPAAIWAKQSIENLPVVP